MDPNDANFDRILLSELSDIVDIVLRVPILFVIDLVLNGALINAVQSYFPHIFSSTSTTSDVVFSNSTTTSSTVFDVYFALERNYLTNEPWSKLSWSSYFVLYQAYLTVLLILFGIFVLETRMLVLIASRLAPILLILVSTILCSIDNLRQGTPPQSSPKDLLSMAGLIAYAPTLVRMVIGFGSVQFYVWIRGEPYWRRALGRFAWIAREQRTISNPLTYWSCVLVAKEFAPSASPWMALLFFSPILIAELGQFVALVKDHLIPHAAIFALRLAPIVARPDLMQIQLVLKEHWNRLRVPRLLRLFFVARISFLLGYAAYVGLIWGAENEPFGVFTRRKIGSDWIWFGTTTSGEEMKEPSNDDGDPLDDEDDVGVWRALVSLLQYLLIRSCETTPAILATTSIVSLIGQLFGYVFHWILTGERKRRLDHQHHDDDPDNPNNDEDHANVHADAGGANNDDDDDSHEGIGQLSAMLFLILAIQTGLSSLSSEKRLWKVCRNGWLLSMAILHFVHHMVHARLTRLCTHGRYPMGMHVRAIGLGVFLFVSPILFIRCSWSVTNWANPWLLSVAIFAVELSVKMLVTFVTYALLLRDLNGTPSEDRLYQVKTLGAVLDFAFGIFLLINGLWILVYEHGGVLRTIMICVHGYFNIYERARKGLMQMRRRRTAQRKLDTLANADAGKLASIGDEVCPICYVELAGGDSTSGNNGGGNGTTTAAEEVWGQRRVKVTRCGHLLHEGCLLKWLYIRDTCPLCHARVFNETPNLRTDEEELNDDDL